MTELVTAKHAEEGGHFYRKDGSPAYTIIGKNGKERPTTLRDARKLGFVPGVSTINKCAAAPGLQNWIIDQNILAALTTPRIDGEDETAYLSRIKSDAKEQAIKAAERGTLIHSWVQGGFEGKPVPLEGVKFYTSALDTIEKECGPQEWICEKSFATERYGGKCDLHSDEYLIDFKSTDKDLTTVKTWDEHALQLAAYEKGLGANSRKCGILYIHKETAESRLIWIPSNELEKGWRMFSALVEYYYAKSGLGQ